MRKADERMLRLWRKLPAEVVADVAERWEKVWQHIPETREREDDPAVYASTTDRIAASMPLLLVGLGKAALRRLMEAIEHGILDGTLWQAHKGPSSGALRLVWLTGDAAADRRRAITELSGDDDES